MKPAIVLLILGLALVGGLNRPPGKLIEFKPQIIPPSDLKYFTLGFKLAIADSLWLRALQADDFCESTNSKSSFNPALLLEDVLRARLSPSRCHMGWVYKMFNLITDLNPKFKWVYKIGGVQLSIAVDDREGARLIFEKGIKVFPEDWQLLYRAAYHYIFEVQDAGRASEILTLAIKHPEAPPIIHLLAASLANLSGRGLLAIGILEDYLRSTKPGTDGFVRAEQRLKEIRKILESSAKKK